MSNDLYMIVIYCGYGISMPYDEDKFKAYIESGDSVLVTDDIDSVLEDLEVDIDEFDLTEAE